MRNHDTPTCGLTHVGSLDTLSHGTYLVNLQQESVTPLLVDTLLDTFRVCNKEIVTDNLDLVSHKSCHLLIGHKIILIKWILNADNGIVIDHVFVEINSLILR